MKSKIPMIHFILPDQPKASDKRPRNAFGYLKGFGKAYNEYYDKSKRGEIMKTGMKVVRALNEVGITFNTLHSKKHKADEQVAEIIERESGVREMLEALELCQVWLVNSTPIGMDNFEKPMPVIAKILQKYGAE